MRDDMIVVVDGAIYQLQSHGGISRLFNEILPRMCDIDDSLRIQPLTEGSLKPTLPQHAHIELRSIFPVGRYLRPGRLWRPILPLARQLAIKMQIGRGMEQIWHSTYYTFPESWDGARVVTVVDMIPELFPQLFDTLWNEELRQRKRRYVLASDAVICISQTTTQDVQRFYGINHVVIRVVPLA